MYRKQKVIPIGSFGTYTGKDGNKGRTPSIPLMGKWLVKCGFTEGAKVNIDAEQGFILIELIKEGKTA